MNDIEEANEKESNSKGDPTRRDAYIGFAVAGGILVLALILFTVSGFGPYEETSLEARAPTLWDWMELLIVPAVLALGALWFNKTQKDTELNIAEKARAADREIAEKARTADREIAEARQRQATLEAYYDRMTDLLLTHDLRATEKDDEKRSIARARTVAVVRSLDGERNNQLFAFLRTSKLMESDAPVIDPSGIDLERVDLRGADLCGANLHEALLFEANLFEANLSGADLRGASLSGADLSEANLRRADLSGADVRGADLSEADVRGAKLHGAKLNWTDLSGARDWSMEQLEQAKSLEGAIMPDGVQLGRGGTDYIERIEGPTFDEWKAQYLAKQDTESRG